ncbi:MAG: chemotaxis protein CheX [Candidatus Omnitrophica bacterium]|nr:chemotaxis protein CheX [Candidatus Omnitrophota bacterium]
MAIEINQAFIEKMSGIMEKMVGDSLLPMGITVSRKNATEHVNFQDVVFCSIGITGAFNGNLSIVIPQKTACSFVGKMIGMSFEQVTDDVLDGCREITNMVAGVIKMEMAAQSVDINIGLPTSMIGHGLRIRFNPADKYVHQQYTTSEGDLEVYLALNEQETSAQPSAEKKPAVAVDAATALLNKIKNSKNF